MSTGTLQDRINAKADGQLKRKINGAFTRLYSQANIAEYHNVTLGTGTNTRTYKIKEVLAAVRDKTFESQQPGARSTETELYMRRIDKLEKQVEKLLPSVALAAEDDKA